MLFWNWHYLKYDCCVSDDTWMTLTNITNWFFFSQRTVLYKEYWLLAKSRICQSSINNLIWLTIFVFCCFFSKKKPQWEWETCDFSSKNDIKSFLILTVFEDYFYDLLKICSIFVDNDINFISSFNFKFLYIFW